MILSFVLCARNDRYMGDSLWRLQVTLNHVARAAQDVGRTGDVEVMVTDWGSETPLHDVVKLTPVAAGMTSFLWLPPDLAYAAQRGSPFPEVLALNAAVRRTRGDYIGRIDQDTLVGTRFLRTFFAMHDGTLNLGVQPDRAQFFSCRRRIPYRFAARCPPADVVSSALESFGRWLTVETAPTWAPFYVASVGIYLAHRSLWHEAGGYDEAMIHMGSMETNLIARLMNPYPLIDLGALTDHDFYHLEHYHPRAVRSFKTHRSWNDDSFLAEERIAVLHPNGAGWGMAGHDLQQHRSPPRAPAGARPSPGAVWPIAVAAVSQTAADRLWRLCRGTPDRVSRYVAVWLRRARLLVRAIHGQPLSAWPGVVRASWRGRGRVALSFPRNIHRAGTGTTAFDGP